MSGHRMEIKFDIYVYAIAIIYLSYQFTLVSRNRLLI